MPFSLSFQRLGGFGLFLCLAGPILAESSTPRVEAINIRRVFHNGEHNAFTDLIRFQDRFYLAFRSCPDGHAVHPTSSIIILASEDARDWKPVHRFSVPRRDTRDPHFLEFQGRLFVYTGTWYSGEGPLASKDYEMNTHLGYAVHTRDGRAWSDPVMLEGTYGHYIWRAAAHDGRAYLCGRRKREFMDTGGRVQDRTLIESVMLESNDGLVWRKRALFQETFGDETAFLFDSDGTLTAIGRRGSGPAQLIRSGPPYLNWQRQDLDRYIGGPLLARWGNRMVVGGRRNVSGEGPRTSLCWLSPQGKLTEFVRLPSGGDNSYPGWIALSPTRALVSWYSSHEKDPETGQTITAIYLADLVMEE